MSITSLRMLAAASVCLIATSLGAAIEMYDELPPGDMNLMYQEHNYINPDPQPALPESKVDNDMRNFLLYKMLRSFRNQDATPNVLAGPKWIPLGTVLVPPETFDLSLLKGSIIKRIADRDNMKLNDGGPARTNVQKWKIKKGKVGSHMICYFKLCAFRPSL